MDKNLRDRVEKIIDGLKCNALERWNICPSSEINDDADKAKIALCSLIEERIEEKLKEYQESLFKSGMVIMKDGKVVKLEDFFIKENQNEEK